MTIKLTDDQQHIYDGIIDKVDHYPGRYDCVIRGYAGTGKSTTVAQIIKTLATGYSLAVTSPTHKANAVLREMISNAGVPSDHADVMTIHSFLGLKLVNKKNKQVLELDPSSPNAKKRVDVLLVDECSMISTDLYMHILNAAPRVRRAIIFIGDECQLPPVEPERENTLVSPTFSHGEQYRLTEVLRQALDNPIIALATAIRSCIDTNVDPLTHLRAIEEESTIMKTHCRFTFQDLYFGIVDECYDRGDMKTLLDAVDRYKMISYTNYNVDSLNSTIRSRLFPELTDELVKGEPIVFEETNLQCPHANQAIITCPDITKDIWMGINCWRVDGGKGSYYIVGPQQKAAFKKHLDDLVNKINLGSTNPITKRPYTWGDYYIIKEKMNVVGYPYAQTFHKSQGSTYDMIFMDLAYVNSVADINDKTRMLYTAITRPRDGLIILE